MSPESSEIAATTRDGRNKSSGPTLVANVAVGQVGSQGARITGIEIGTLNLTALSEAQAPSEDAVRDYLNRIGTLDKTPQVVPPADGSQIETQLQALWNLDFYVHQSGQVAGTSIEVGQAIRDLLYNDSLAANRLIILAEAGAGKTGVLKRLRSGTATEAIVRLTESPIAATPSTSKRLGNLVVPIFVDLSNLSGDILALIAAAYNHYAAVPLNTAATDQLLRDYNCLLLFDELDNIRSDLPTGGIQSLRQFVDGHPSTRHVFSCRIGSYSGQLGRAIVLELDLLTRHDVRTVLGDQGYAELSPILQDLARYRLMLEDIIQSRQTGKVDLATKGQLVQFMMRQRYKLFGKDQETRLTERLLEWLAFQMLHDGVASYGEEQMKERVGSYLQDWREALNWRAALKNLEDSGVLKYDERRFRWEFEDRNARTYFAAAALARGSDLLSVALEAAADPIWTEAFEIVVGIINDPSHLLFELVDREARVAARCFGFARPPIQASFQDALLDALIDALGRETAEGREDIARFLNRNPLTQVEHTLRVLLDALQREWRSGSIRALMQALLPLVTPIPPDTDAIRQELKSEDERDRLKTVVQLWRAFVDGPARVGSIDIDPAARQAWQAQCEQRLVDAMNDRNQVELVRGAAAIALGAIGTDSARTSLLTKWRKESMTETVGWCVTEALAHLEKFAEIKDVQQAALDVATRKRRRPAQPDKPEPATEQTADSTVVDDAERQTASDVHRERRRVWAFYLLGYLNFKDEPTDLLFKALEAQSEDSYRVRGYAAQAIGRLQPKDGRQKLLDALSTEQDLRVMRKIVWALSQVGTPDTIPILENYQRTGRVQARTIVQRSIAEIRRRYDAGG